MLILIAKFYDQGSVLIVNSRVQCVSSAQMLKLTLQDHQRVLHSGVLTLRGSYDQGFSQSGVQINVYYMTSLCPDVGIDRKILRSGVGVDRKFLHLKGAQMLILTLQCHIHVKPVS